MHTLAAHTDKLKCGHSPRQGPNTRKRSLHTVVPASASVALSPPAAETPVRRDQPGASTSYETTLVKRTRKHTTSLGPVTAQVLADQKSCFTSLLEEYEYWVEDAWVEGEIPQELCGTWFRNGPGLLVDNPHYHRHHFDGDGMVIRFCFKDGKLFFKNKFVRTKGFLQEQAAGKPMLRGSFTRGAADGSPLFNPLDLTFKNVANTGVVQWAGQLFALWEGGLPHLLDPRSLNTISETRIGGQLDGNAMAGHYRIVREVDGSRRWVAFSTQVSFTGTSITFYEFGENGRAIHTTKHSLAVGIDITFVHDIVVTEHYYVVLLGPLAFDALTFGTRYLLGGASIAECLRYDESRPTRMLLYPRPGRSGKKGLAPRTLEVKPFFPFHHINAYEVEHPGGSMQVVVDTIGWDELRLDCFHEGAPRNIYDPDYYNGGCRSEYQRLVADLDSGEVRCTRMLPRTVEFPSLNPEVNGRPHRYAWLLADMVDHPVLWGPPQAIVKVTLPMPSTSSSPSSAQSHALSPSLPAAALPSATASSLSSMHGSHGLGNASSTHHHHNHHNHPQHLTHASTVIGAKAEDVDVWYVGDRKFPPGEPQFVPRPGATREDDGWLLVVLHDAGGQRAELVILDAACPSAGPLATVHLPHTLPMGLHGSWSPQYLGPDPQDASMPRFRVTNRVRAL